MKVAVVDYGMGNLFSVSRALEHCGATVVITDAPDVIASAPRVVLPGVGAFGNGMQGLRQLGLIDVLRERAARDAPTLGVCLGMQMFASISEEFGEHAGLGIIPGAVRGLETNGLDGSRQKVPHVGWTPLMRPDGADWTSSLLGTTRELTSVYVVHSYHFVPEAQGDLLASFVYGGRTVAAAVRRGNVTGFQFHPEKSGEAGLEMLRVFVDGR